jgi:hypothetical protein
MCEKEKPYSFRVLGSLPRKKLGLGFLCIALQSEGSAFPCVLQSNEISFIAAELLGRLFRRKLVSPTLSAYLITLLCVQV